MIGIESLGLGAGGLVTANQPQKTACAVPARLRTASFFFPHVIDPNQGQVISEAMNKTLLATNATNEPRRSNRSALLRLEGTGLLQYLHR